MVNEIVYFCAATYKTKRKRN